MSRMMDELKRLNETRKVEESIVVRESVETEEKKPIADAKKHKEIYFIGVLIVVLVAFSAISISLSFKTLMRLKGIEQAAALTDKEILLRLEKSETAFISVLKDLKKQQDDLQAFTGSVHDQNKESLAQMDELQKQFQDLKASLKEKGEALDEMMYAQSTFKTSVENSINDLKTADKLMYDKQAQLAGEVKKIMESNSYLYSAY